MRKHFNYRALSAILILILLSLSGCAFTAFDRPQIDTSQPLPTRSFDLPPSEAFKVASETALSLGYEIDISDPQRGLIRTKSMGYSIQGYANCGSWHGVQLGGVVVNVLIIQVKEEAAGKSVVSLDSRLAGFFQGRNGMGMVTREESFRCVSYGGVETRYLTKLSAYAAYRMNCGPKPAEEKDKVRKAVPDDDPFKVLELENALGLLSPQEYAQRKAKLPIKETGEGVR